MADLLAEQLPTPVVMMHRRVIRLLSERQIPRAALGLNPTSTQTDVPLEVTGLPTNSRDYASIHTAFSIDDVCVICHDRFAHTMQQPCLKMHGCGHLLQHECMDTLVNTLHPRKSHVGCPYCRRNICPTRTYRAVFPTQASGQVNRDN